MTDAVVGILSAGAPKTGVRLSAEAFAARSANRVDIEFATAPVIKKRVETSSASADVVVAPVGAMREFAAAGHVLPESVAELGSVRVGIVVRNDVPDPDISTVDALVAALRDADKVVFNDASSGQYIVEMLDRIGLGEELASRIVRVPTGAAVMEHLAAHPGEKAVGFGQITEIRMHDDLGTHLVGPLPDEVGKRTTYAAAVFSGDARPEAARELVDFMVSPEGRSIFKSTGVI